MSKFANVQGRMIVDVPESLRSGWFVAILMWCDATGHTHRRDTHPDFCMRPVLECADGFSVSVQASVTHYCSPRETLRDVLGYTHFEVGFPSQEVPAWMEYAEDPSNPTGTVYGWVPHDIIDKALTAHGGVVKVSYWKR